MAHPDTGRLGALDKSKAVLIFLVVLGHFHYVSGPVIGKDMIYAFHVPGFVIMTGYLLPERLFAVSLRTLWVKPLSKLLVAYGFFSFLAIMVWWFEQSITMGQPVNPWPAIASAAYGIDGGTGGLVHRNQPLWYFPFIISSIVFAWLLSRSPLVAFGLALGFVAVTVFHEGPRLPWSLETAWAGAFFLLVGHKLRLHRRLLASWLSVAWRRYALLTLAIVVFSLTAGINGPVNLNGADFGGSVALFVLAALSGSLAIILIVTALPDWWGWRVISDNTLIIFATHIYWVRLAAQLPQPHNPLAHQVALYAISSCVVLACIATAGPIRAMLDRIARLPTTARTT